jgi:hypothetical protein
MKEGSKMAKKALCVGINDYPFEGNDLKGCVNDAKGWAAMLTGHFGFSDSDIKLLLDEQASKEAILAALEEMIVNGEPGDTLVFTNSSHGTYLADESGDEQDKYDEAICPYDCKENLIVDDELREIFNKLKPEVSFSMISDSCHSGNLHKALVVDTPDQRRVRFLNPSLLGNARLLNPFIAKPRGSKISKNVKIQEILLSGCKSIEYSYDAMIDGDYHGAMTYYALKAVEEAQYQLTFKELHKMINDYLKAEGYPQHPQLEGRASLKSGQVFK